MGTAGARTVGVEEELLLVDVTTGRPRSVAGRVIDAVAAQQLDHVGPEGGIEGELQRYMVETQSSVCTSTSPTSSRELRDWRHTVSIAAREAGAGSAAPLGLRRWPGAASSRPSRDTCGWPSGSGLRPRTC